MRKAFVPAVFPAVVASMVPAFAWLGEAATKELKIGALVNLNSEDRPA